MDAILRNMEINFRFHQLIKATTQAIMLSEMMKLLNVFSMQNNLSMTETRL